MNTHRLPGLPESVDPGKGVKFGVYARSGGLKAVRALAVGFLLSFTSSALCQGDYGIIYPLAPDPYREVFESIVSGVESGLKRPPHKYRLKEGVQETDIEEWIANNGIGSIVSLGSESLKLCENNPEHVGIVAGAILSPSQSECRVQGGIALAPAPSELFLWLKRLAPQVETVSVVYNENFNQWLVDYGKAAAKDTGLELVAIPAENIQKSAVEHRKLVDSGIGPKHAVWLPQDPYTVDQDNILSELLDASWSQEFVLFSSNPAHVKRGVLFALYPDYVAMGVRLGRMAAQPAVKDSSIKPLNDVLIAVNLRAANHLKLNLSNSEIRGFDLTFPASR